MTRRADRRPPLVSMLCILGLSCDIGMEVEPEPYGTVARVGPHEIEVAGSEPTEVSILVDLTSSKPITAYVDVSIEGVVIDRGAPDDIDMHVDCDGEGDGDSMTTNVLSGQTIRARASDVQLPTQLACTLTFTPRDPLAAPVFIWWITAVDLGHDGKDRGGVVAVVDVMAREP